MSDRKLAKTVFQKFRGAIACPPSEARRIVDILVSVIRAERERSAVRVEAEALSGEADEAYNRAIRDAAAAVRKGGNDA